MILSHKTLCSAAHLLQELPFAFSLSRAGAALAAEPPKLSGEHQNPEPPATHPTLSARRAETLCFPASRRQAAGGAR